MAKLVSKISHYRKTHGFGVHSPFAYSMIRDTLRCRDGYYAYDDIDRMEGVDYRLLKLFLRVVARISPASFTACGEYRHAASEVAKMATGCVVVEDEDVVPDMLFVCGEMTGEDHELARKVLEAEGTVFLAHQRRNSLMPLTDMGMAFTNGTETIVVARHDLPRQLYKVNF